MDRFRLGRWRWVHPRAAPSRTSQVVAAVRAQLPRPHTPDGDPGAQSRLCTGMRAPRRLALRPHLAARTRFFDDQVLAALGRGVSQVVILGAGYDDRALRFRSPGVRYFELDHPATQLDKGQRLRRMGADFAALTLIPADFRSADVAAVLAASGHDPGRPSLFMCEGLLVYLDQDTAVRLLAALRSRAPAGSVLAASLATHPEGIDSDVVVARSNAARPNSGTEPWRTILPATAQLRLVSLAGWQATEYFDDAKLDTGAKPDRSLLVAAHPGPVA